MFVSKIGGVAKSGVSFSSRRGSSKTIVICGGAGFLGSQLCHVLIAQKHVVICIDNLLTGRMANIQDLMACPNFRFVKHDVIDPLDLDGPVDQIYNLACAASPTLYQMDPVHTFKTCVIGAINLLELAQKKGARILQASTSEVYGDPNVSPQPENYFGNVNTTGPRSCYDEGKRAAETLFHDFNERYGVVTKIARIFNTYGPDMRADDGRVVSNFIVQALRGEDLTVYGKGTQTRSFCYRDDMISGLIRLMNSPKRVSHPVNIGNPSEFTVLELAQQVIKKVNSNSKIAFSALPVDDPHQRKPDISMAERVLKWTPSISLEDGLDRTIEYFRGVDIREATKIKVTA